MGEFHLGLDYQRWMQKKRLLTSHSLESCCHLTPDRQTGQRAGGQVWSCRVPRVRVYIHDISQVVAVLDQPPPFSSQSLHDTVKGPDGLKQEHTSDQSGRPKGSGSTGLVGSMNQFKQQSFFFYLQPHWEGKIWFQWRLGQMEENHRQLTD